MTRPWSSVTSTASVVRGRERRRSALRHFLRGFGDSLTTLAPTVNCGVGADTALVDDVDVVAQDR